MIATMTRALAISLAVFSVACSGDSPTAPTSTTPPPPPPAPIIAFTPDTTAPVPNSFWLETPEPTTSSGTLTVRVNATFTRTFHKFRGTLLYDTGVITVVNYSEGEYLKQGGAVLDTSVTGVGTNRVTIRIDRPDSLPGASGSGTVLVLRFSPASGARSGTSPLQWTDTSAYTPSFSDVLARTYGGSVTLR